MGDLSEIRGLLVTITFLGVLALLIGLIPYQFYIAGEMRTVDYPEEGWETIDIYSFAETSTFYLNETGGWDWFFDPTYYGHHIDIGNWDIDLYYKDPNQTNLRLFIHHLWYVYWIFPADHDLEFFNKAGASQSTVLTVEEMQEDAGGESHVTYRAVCEHTTYHVTFAYNSTTYSSFENAWDMGELAFFAGVNFDDVNTAYNAWNLISMLLFFQLPDVHWVVNGFMAIPIWIVIGYVTTMLIWKAIGVIFGGGA